MQRTYRTIRVQVWLSCPFSTLVACGFINIMSVFQIVCRHRINNLRSSSSKLANYVVGSILSQSVGTSLSRFHCKSKPVRKYNSLNWNETSYCNPRLKLPQDRPVALTSSALGRELPAASHMLLAAAKRPRKEPLPSCDLGSWWIRNICLPGYQQ